MFLFGKKAKKCEVKKTLSDGDKQILIQQAEAKVSALDNLGEEQQAPLLNEIGSLYFQADAWDEAIRFYEKSLTIKREMGKSYTNLMTLYNKKRQKAAEKKNDAEIRYYFDKVQEMMQMSKDMIRGKM